MRNLFLSFVVCCFVCLSCGVHPTYDDAIEAMQDIESYEDFARFVFETEGRVAGEAAVCYGGKLPPEFIASRDSFYIVVDNKLAEYKCGHFVELRTVLYESAAAACELAGNVEGVNAIKVLLKHCSAAMYIDGQRVCDPPKMVRERYEQAKRKCEK